MEESRIEEIIIDFPRNLENNSNDISFLSNLWHSLKNRKNTKIIFDLENTKHLSVNVCSSLGLILEKIKLRKNQIYFRKIRNEIKKVLFSNEFLKGIENENSNWNRGNFLAYKKFSVRDKSKFEEYLIENIRVFVEENTLSCDIKEVARAISEMFANIKMHTNSKDVVTCGYYEEVDKEMYFTISNHGITIAKNIEKINEYLFKEDIEAIEWSIKKSSSTRKDTETGGLGLYTTRKFIKEIRGSMWIVSGRGYWYENDNNIEKYEMKSYFPGTIITFRLPLNYIRDINEELSGDIISLNDIIGGELW